MKALLVTGILAEEIVKKYSKQSHVETEVLALKVPVAAFLTPETISKALKKTQLKKFDLILVPGQMRGDAAIISKAVGVPTFKGPRYAADLPIVLDSLGEVKLSTVTPACDLLKEKLQQKALEEIVETEKNRKALLKRPGNIIIKNLAVGKDFPMRILAEIVDAALMPTEQIQKIAKRYVALGADIIDVGMVAGENRPSDAKRIVAAVKAVVDVPVSIDTLNPEEIEAAVLAGADLVLSLDAGNLEAIAPILKNVAVVAIPTNQREGYIPKTAQERVQLLEQIISKVKSLGANKVLADLILEPSAVLESFVAFRQFAQRNPDIPLFVGVSNVTELMDADSVGINALLAKVSSEIAAAILLATEKSDKAKGTIAEEAAASKMMFLAKKRGSVPKDLGINLLVLKDKRNREEPYDRSLERRAVVIIASANNTLLELDKLGSFRIAIDREEGKIVAQHFFSANVDSPDAIFKGKNAQDIYKDIARSHLVSAIDHAAYLGSELVKAEIALKTGKEYLQESPLF